MPNKFYEPGEQRAAKVNDLFATVARHYDLLNDLQSFGLHRRWKLRVVALANPQPGERALDLCCGTGDISLLLAACGAEVTGLDFSEPMLAVARRRTLNFQPSTFNFIQGDALNAPFPDASFDIVTIGYGLRNLASVDDGLREMRRLLKPGGRLVILECGKPDNLLLRTAYFAHLRYLNPLLGKIFCGDAAAYAYILESLKHYPGQQAVAEKMRGLELTKVHIVNFLGGAMAINYGERMR